MRTILSRPWNRLWAVLSVFGLFFSLVACSTNTSTTATDTASTVVSAVTPTAPANTIAATTAPAAPATATGTAIPALPTATAPAQVPATSAPDTVAPAQNPTATALPATTAPAPTATKAPVAMPTSLTWTKLGDWGNARVTSMVVLPQAPETVFALTTTETARTASFKATLYRSNDGGAVWTKIADKVPGMVLGVDSANAQTILVAMGASGLSGINRPTYRSSDGGKTFHSMSLEGVSSFVYAGGHVYAAADSGVYRSDDNGAHWTAFNSGLPTHDNFSGVQSIAFDPKAPSTLYALISYGEGGGGQLYKSTDAGAQWTLLSLSGLTGATRVYVNPDDPRRLYVFDMRGFWKSTDAGATWQNFVNGVAKMSVFSLAVDSHRPGGMYYGDSNGFFATSDGGQNWQSLGNLPAGQPNEAIYPDALVYGEPGGAPTLFTHITNGAIYKALLP